jgi:peroxiredoxin
MPIVDRIARRYEEQGLRVVGVNTSDELDTLADWSKRNQPRYPIVFDEGNRIARSFGVRSLPTLVVVGKDGNIVAIRTGLTDEGDLDKLVRSAL